VSWFILKFISRYGPIRVSRDQELRGLDEALHGESAYRL
jgi:ammonia channel protein AmtB